MGQLDDPAVDVRTNDRGECGEQVIQPGVGSNSGHTGHIHNHRQRVDIDKGPCNTAAHQQYTGYSEHARTALHQGNTDQGQACDGGQQSGSRDDIQANEHARQ